MFYFGSFNKKLNNPIAELQTAHTNPEFKKHTQSKTIQATYTSSVSKIMHLPVAEFVTGVIAHAQEGVQGVEK